MLIVASESINNDGSPGRGLGVIGLSLLRLGPEGILGLGISTLSRRRMMLGARRN